MLRLGLLRCEFPGHAEPGIVSLCVGLTPPSVSCPYGHCVFSILREMVPDILAGFLGGHGLDVSDQDSTRGQYGIMVQEAQSGWFSWFPNRPGVSKNRKVPHGGAGVHQFTGELAQLTTRQLS